MLWDDFLNSVHRDWRGDGTAKDRLDDEAWFREWIEYERLNPERLPNGKEMASLKKLRELLQRMAEAFAAGAPLSAADLDALNAAMAEGAVIRQVTSDGTSYKLTHVAVGRDWRGIEAIIAASFAETMAEGDPSRIRICDNPNCRWVYHDDTRNRSKRYCDDKLCGNLMKVRRFRARQKAEQDASRSGD
ncbi:CGNR zinc finger domain-containing protein [Cohnella suwonensis]|uniref:CGNR zinc finger domain-containing protein n=1 Tax=Cohnella suwonensis TaxID=696072 RepID=A0ABW0M2C1_9BACL